MTCAIVDAHGAGRLLPDALRRRGVRCVHVRSPFPDPRLPGPPEGFAADLAHGGDLASTARALRELGVRAVLAGAESGVLLADELAAELAVPGNGTRNPLARRDKHEMQRAVLNAGLAAAPGLRSASAAEVVAWAVARDEWPVVLKPVLSAGTDNVLLCESPEQVAAAHAKIMGSVDRYGRPNGTVLAQRFLVGTEHYVNSVSRDGAHQVVEVWRYHKRIVDDRAIYDYEDLLDPTDPAAEAVAAYVRSVLDALEVRNGAGHTEVMLTEEGPVLIECGSRLGGGQLPELLTRCTGTNQVDALAGSIADPERFRSAAAEPYRLRLRLRCVNLISTRDGGRVPGPGDWAAVEALPSFAGAVLTAPGGTPLSRTVDMATCPGTVYLAAPDESALDADRVRLRELERDLYG
ncbi:ATP-grasp domain-containing protein [Saccharopolyspora sp. MS10]|uniref:ATP-grasp domain-containing protein n=1 Tax=Saccharopolyspora sp. MS10 TaxID=3385973 RepID=UPI0039A39E63